MTDQLSSPNERRMRDALLLALNGHTPDRETANEILGEWDAIHEAHTQLLDLVPRTQPTLSAPKSSNPHAPDRGGV